MICRAKRKGILIHKGNLNNERGNLMETVATPSRSQKHREIIECISMLETSIERLEGLTHTVLQGSDAETAKNPGGKAIQANISLGQFLESYPDYIRALTQRIDVAHNELNATLF